jgi:hypothetical protein
LPRLAIKLICADLIRRDHGFSRNDQRMRDSPIKFDGTLGLYQASMIVERVGEVSINADGLSTLEVVDIA